MVTMGTITRGAIIIGTSIFLAALVFNAGEIKKLVGGSSRSGLVREAMTYTIDSDTIYENSSSGGKWEIYKSDYNISDCPVLSPDGKYLAFAEGSASYGRFVKVLGLNGGEKATVILDSNDQTFSLLGRLVDSGLIPGKEIVHVFMQFRGWTPDNRMIVLIVGDYSLADYKVGAIMTVEGEFTDVSVSKIANPFNPNAEKQPPPRTLESESRKLNSPRFDFGAFSGAALPGIVILSGVALGILIRNRQDAARIATGNPPLRYGHEIGALAAIFYLAGVGALVALPKSGSWLIALALGALFHFLRIGNLRKRAEKEAASAGE
jgi:hypothetical protein